MFFRQFSVSVYCSVCVTFCKTLFEYVKQFPLARTALLEWYHQLEKADFKNFNELKKVYGNASFAAKEGLELRQSYTRTLKRLEIIQT